MPTPATAAPGRRGGAAFVALSRPHEGTLALRSRGEGARRSLLVLVENIALLQREKQHSGAKSSPLD